MAIDTVDKRASAGNLRGLELFPVADGTISQDDRLHVAGFYRGISVTGAITYLSMGKIFLFTSANWTPTPTWYFEVTMKASSGTAKARLFNLTDSVEVTDSVVNTANATHTRVRSSAITLADGKEYEAQFGTGSADSGEGRVAAIVGVV